MEKVDDQLHCCCGRSLSISALAACTCLQHGVLKLALCILHFQSLTIRLSLQYVDVEMRWVVCTLFNSSPAPVCRQQCTVLLIPNWGIHLHSIPMESVKSCEFNVPKRERLMLSMRFQSLYVGIDSIVRHYTIQILNFLSILSPEIGARVYQIARPASQDTVSTNTDA